MTDTWASVSTHQVRSSSPDCKLVCHPDSKGSSSWCASFAMLPMKVGMGPTTGFIGRCWGKFVWLINLCPLRTRANNCLMCSFPTFLTSVFGCGKEPFTLGMFYVAIPTSFICTSIDCRWLWFLQFSGRFLWKRGSALLSQETNLFPDNTISVLRDRQYKRK